jgi:predicted Zn-dependent protease
MQRKILSLAIVILMAIQCATVPLTGRKQFSIIPSSEVMALGSQSYAQILKENRTSSNSQYVNSVKTVGSNLSGAVERYFASKNQSDLLKGYAWEYNVLQSKEVNAFCLPGGKIAFYEGIMPVCINDNGVAVVMSHEVSHAIANHGSERMSEQMAVQLGGMALDAALQQKPETTRQIAMAAFGAGTTVGVLLPFSRTQESEADEIGLYFLAMAGYDPSNAIDFWQRMMEQSKGAPPEFLSTHPSDQTRINDLKKHMAKAMQFYNKSQKK